MVQRFTERSVPLLKVKLEHEIVWKVWASEPFGVSGCSDMVKMECFYGLRPLFRDSRCVVLLSAVKDLLCWLQARLGSFVVSSAMMTICVSCWSLPMCPACTRFFVSIIWICCMCCNVVTGRCFDGTRGGGGRDGMINLCWVGVIGILLDGFVVTRRERLRVSERLGCWRRCTTGTISHVGIFLTSSDLMSISDGQTTQSIRNILDMIELILMSVNVKLSSVVLWKIRSIIGDRV